ncbi:MAG TPA: EamA family transporter [Candidatus Nanoarchaeia archaeon]|nr:EamA family transporter [Candidatus Nanoarchaeia archaeon]
MEWYILVLVSAFVFGISEVIKKKVLAKEHTLQFTSSFHLVIFAIILVLLPKVEFYLTGFQWFMIAIKSAFLALAAFCFFRLLRHYEISEVEPLKNISPLFLLPLGFALLGERPTALNLSGILLLIAGTYIIESDHKIINLKEPFRILKEKKIVLLLVYLIFISLCAIIDRYIIKTVDIYSYYFIQSMLTAAIFMGIEFARKDGMNDLKNAFRRDWLAIITAAILVVASDILYLKAIAIPAALIVLVIPMKRLSTLVSAFIGGELFHEKGLKIKIAACLIMVAGAWMVIM